jgi:hypothetical protein
MAATSAATLSVGISPAHRKSILTTLFFSLLLDLVRLPKSHCYWQVLHFDFGGVLIVHQVIIHPDSPPLSPSPRFLPLPAQQCPARIYLHPAQHLQVLLSSAYILSLRCSPPRRRTRLPVLLPASHRVTYYRCAQRPIWAPYRAALLDGW